MTLTILHDVALGGPWPHYIPAPHNLIPGHSSPHHWAFASAAPLPRRSCDHSFPPGIYCSSPKVHFKYLLWAPWPTPFRPLLRACIVGYPMVIFLALICYAFDLYLLLSL